MNFFTNQSLNLQQVEKAFLRQKMQNRLTCIYHPSELITNFCQDKTCLMPLCPACISQHTQYHEDQQTRPLYCSINQIIANTYAQIDNCIQSLKRDQDRNGQLIVQINLLEEKVHAKIKDLKEYVYRIIEESIIDLQRDIIQRLKKWHEDKNIFCLEQSQKKDRLIIGELSQLQNLREGLKMNRVLSNIIYFHREKQQEAYNLHSQITNYLHTNESYKPKIEINSEALYSLSAILGRSVKVNSQSFAAQNKLIKNNLESSINKSNIVYKNNIDAQNFDRIKLKSRDKSLKKPELMRQYHNQGYSPKKNTDDKKIKNQNSESFVYKSKMDLLQNGNSAKNINRNLSFQSNNKNSPYYRFDEKNYDNISKKVLEMRNENQKLSKYLKDRY